MSDSITIDNVNIELLEKQLGVLCDIIARHYTLKTYNSVDIDQRDVLYVILDMLQDCCNRAKPT